jgi:hypothetical protein
LSRPGGSIDVVKRFGLTFSDHVAGTTEAVAVEIPDDEWQLLLRFSVYADQPETTSFLRDGLADHCEITAMVRCD